jgi:hypothetical protein
MGEGYVPCHLPLIPPKSASVMILSQYIQIVPVKKIKNSWNERRNQRDRDSFGRRRGGWDGIWRRRPWKLQAWCLLFSRLSGILDQIAIYNAIKIHRWWFHKKSISGVVLQPHPVRKLSGSWDPEINALIFRRKNPFGRYLTGWIVAAWKELGQVPTTDNW